MENSCAAEVKSALEEVQEADTTPKALLLVAF